MSQETLRSQLYGRNILLGVTGGIACYKACELVRRLKEFGADVRVVMTRGSLAFITPLSFQAVSGNPVHTELLDEKAEAGMGHIELAKWADRVLIAPASANFIERLARGSADDLLSTICLATRAPVQVAPAMNQAMWSNPACQNNIQTLKNNGVAIFGPGSGEQACGDIGAGRMLEPLELVDLIASSFDSGPLTGRKVTITAGPTREAVDPVRYLSNNSSGKMGYALAQAAAEAGAEVVLISGPVSLETPARVRRVDTQSATDMLQAVNEEIPSTDLFIACAAVADYRAAHIAEHKIKKTDDRLTLELVKNPDILEAVGQRNPRPFCVGFAAESENVLANARAKLIRKKIDLVVANDISRPDIGFGQDANEVNLISSSDEIEIPKMDKKMLARRLIEEICHRWLGGNAG
jgi:phosphopantothenoylcysteine decarboxylase / phosphopantothenate---cysteine ligase